MDLAQEKKAAPLLVLEILKKYTDENHYLTQQEIIDILQDVYGIEAERKSIASTLVLLGDLGYDINRGTRGGFALLSRDFETSEVTFLVDAIYSSKSIPASAASRLADKVNSCLSTYERKDYGFLEKTSDIPRTSNNDIFYNIDIIHEAMMRHKRVGFQYMTYDKDGNPVVRNDGYEYIVSPYYLINNFGYYYLICNYRSKYNALNIFRLDYITNINIKEDWELKDMSEIEGLEDFDIKQYLNEHVYLFGGEAVSAVLEIDSEEHTRYVVDWFGSNASFYSEDEKIYARVKCNETSLLYWCLQYAECIKVVEPESLKQRVVEVLETALEKYK